ncbi:MAG: cytochrome oxidase subunit III [Chloroflexi bacterium]|nr:cytochrome oxidase subunit III [Chloroflexota bacterium]
MSTHGSEQHGHHLYTGLDNRKLAMWAFLGSETMFFGCLILVMLINKHNTLGSHGQEIFDLALTSFTTFVLLTSSMSMVLSLAAFRNGSVFWGRIWLGLVMLMGIVFLGGQVYEFSEFVHHGLTPSTNLFGASFFTLVGFHGAHVAIGVLWLGTVMLYSFRGRFRPGSDMWGIELVGLYWHFVDLVWVAIFTLIYLI